MPEDKLGTYITKLMTTILDNEKEDFVKELAMNELSRLNVDIDSFIRKHIDKKETEELDKQKKQEKQLLQEDKNV